MKKLALLLVAAAAWLLLPGYQQPIRAATNWHWQIGGSLPEPGLVPELLHFMPHSLTITVGDSITWTMAEGAPHTVTFLSGAPRPPVFVGIPFAPDRATISPAVAAPSHPGPGVPVYAGSGVFNSGILEPGDSWTLSFAATGTFEFVCLLHRSMRATVTVVPPGAPLPETPEQVSARIVPEIAAHFRDIARATSPQLRRTAAALRADGTVEWQVNTGGAWRPAGFNFTFQGGANAFAPNRLSVHTGDTVTWNFTTPFHTVTFFGQEGPPEDLNFFDELRVPPGAPPGLPPAIPAFNRSFFEPSANVAATGATRYDGIAWLNSGVRGIRADDTLPEDFDPSTPSAIRDTLLSDRFSVTFTRPGSYSYVCMVHPGMFGLIEVHDRAAWPPVHVELTAENDGQRITYYGTVRNLGTATVSNLSVALRIPSGARFVSSQLINAGNPGKVVGSEVQWFLPALTLAPGASIGPFTLVVDAPAGVDPNSVATRGWAQFNTPTVSGGTAITLFDVAPDAPLPPGAGGE